MELDLARTSRPKRTPRQPASRETSWAQSCSWCIAPGGFLQNLLVETLFHSARRADGLAFGALLVCRHEPICPVLVLEDRREGLAELGTPEGNLLLGQFLEVQLFLDAGKLAEVHGLLLRVAEGLEPLRDIRHDPEQERCTRLLIL